MTKIPDKEFGKHPDWPASTRVVHSWHTVCNNCGHNSNLGTHHETILSYDKDLNGKPGCGIEYTHEFEEYPGGSYELKELWSWFKKKLKEPRSIIVFLGKCPECLCEDKDNPYALKHHAKIKTAVTPDNPKEIYEITWDFGDMYCPKHGHPYNYKIIHEVKY